MYKEELKNKYGDEKVLCIPKWYYESATKVIGDEKQSLVVKDSPLEISIHNVGYFDYRYEVEMDETVLQVIPYVVLKYRNKYFVTNRIAGDSRLQGMVAFLGGHIDESDVVKDSYSKSRINGYATIHNGLIRELLEETTMEEKDIVTIDNISEFVDNSSQVSKCHVCNLNIVNVRTNDIGIREIEKLEGKWVTLKELNKLKAIGKTEGWCNIAIDYLNKMEETKE